MLHSFDGPEPPFIVELSLPGNVVQSFEDASIEVCVRLECLASPIPRSTSVIILPSDLFYGAILRLRNPLSPSRGGRHYSLRLHRRRGSSSLNALDRIPNVLTFEVRSNSNMWRGEAKLLIGYFCSSLLDKTANILLWGDVGSGKTSLLNGFLTILSSNYHVQRAFVSMRDVEPVTKTFQEVRLADWAAYNSPLGQTLGKRLQINIYDIFGMQPSASLNSDRYKLLSLIIEAKLPLGTHVSEAVEFLELDDVPSLERKIDSVIIVVGMTHGCNEVQIQTLRNEIQLCHDHSVTPVVVLLGRNGPLDPHAPDDLNHWRSTHNLGPCKIFEMENYVDEDVRSVDGKDIEYFKILRHAAGILPVPAPDGPLRPSLSDRVRLNWNQFYQEIIIASFAFCFLFYISRPWSDVPLLLALDLALRTVVIFLFWELWWDAPPHLDRIP